MSNTFSADNLKFPGDDRRLDFTDLFVFTSPEDPGRTVLIIDSNPTSAPPPIPATATGPEFYPGAVYRINIDTDGDAHADVAFTFTFSEYENGSQTGTAWYATGPEARQPEPAGQVLAESIPVSFDGTDRPVLVDEPGQIRLFAGLRSDPFFADVEGALHGMKWTGHDDFAGNNVDSIALEVPADLLGPGPGIGVWASISRRFAKLAFRVPNESDTASTVKLEVTLPTQAPIAFLSLKPVAGWTATVEKTKLATPIKNDDGGISEAVSKITWMSAGADSAIKAGQFQEFEVSAGPLPEVDQIVFKALQTYSDGTVVRWIEEPVAGGKEPEHSAPILKLAKKTDAAAAAAMTSPADVTLAANRSENTSNGWALGLGIAALVAVVAALVVAVLAWRRVARPTAT